jgi:hypothetical protein
MAFSKAWTSLAGNIAKKAEKLNSQLKAANPGRGAGRKYSG